MGMFIQFQQRIQVPSMQKEGLVSCNTCWDKTRLQCSSCRHRDMAYEIYDRTPTQREWWRIRYSFYAAESIGWVSSRKSETGSRLYHHPSISTVVGKYMPCHAGAV